MARIVAILISLFSTIVPGWAFSAPVTTLGDASTIPALYRLIAHEENVPATVVYCIARVESTKPGLGKSWPWTLNINHKPYYLESRDAALALLKETLDSGEHRVAISLMQVRWDFHAEKFNHDPEQALDPVRNVRVGIQVLKGFRRAAKNKDWWSAIGYYYAGLKNKSAAAKYRQNVLRCLMNYKTRNA